MFRILNSGLPSAVTCDVTLAPGTAFTSMLPAQMQWNPARYQAEGVPAAAALASGSPLAAGSAMGGLTTVIPLLVVAAVLWMLAERHLALKASARAN